MTQNESELIKAISEVNEAWNQMNRFAYSDKSAESIQAHGALARAVGTALGKAQHVNEGYQLTPDLPELVIRETSPQEIERRYQSWKERTH